MDMSGDDLESTRFEDAHDESPVPSDMEEIHEEVAVFSDIEDVQEPGPFDSDSDSTQSDADQMPSDSSMDVSAPDVSALDSIDGTFRVPDVHNESSIIDDAPAEMTMVVTWTKVTASTQRGKDHLTNSNGFSFTVSKRRVNATDWHCSVRNALVKCKARVKEQDGIFYPNVAEHSHPASIGTTEVAQIRSSIRNQGSKKPFTSASQIVESVMRDVLDSEAPCPGMPQPSALVRATNRQRAKSRPTHPQTLDFQINLNAIPDDFLLADVNVSCTSGDKRHLIFSTDKQLELLAKAKSWYVDGTFKLVRTPFTQLFSIHAFIRSGEEVKQIPLAYVVMSGHRTSDYKAIFTALLDRLPTEPAV